MFQIKSDLNLCERLSLTFKDGVPATAVSGSWVTLDSSKEAILTTGAAGMAYPIFSESNRDGTAGFSPDVAASGKFTVLKGSFRAVTNNVKDATEYGNMAIGSALTSGAGGLLEIWVADAGATPDNIVGYVSEKLGTTTYLGTSYASTIEFHSV